MADLSRKAGPGETIRLLESPKEVEAGGGGRGGEHEEDRILCREKKGTIRDPIFDGWQQLI